jgi:hypothetical protein
MENQDFDTLYAIDVIDENTQNKIKELFQKKIRKRGVGIVIEPLRLTDHLKKITDNSAQKDLTTKVIKEKDSPLIRKLLSGFQPVYKCTLTHANRKNEIYYAKLTTNEQNKNIYGVEALLRMGALGYRTPSSTQLYTGVDVGFKDFRLDASIQITKDASAELPYVKENLGHQVTMSKAEAIKLLRLQHKYAIFDNKSINTVQVTRLNDKKKTIFFDPTICHQLDLTNYFNCITLYFKSLLALDEKVSEKLMTEDVTQTYWSRAQQLTLDDVTRLMKQHNKKECFELHLFSLMVDFMIKARLFKKKSIKDLTLRAIKIFMQKSLQDSFYFKNSVPNYYYFRDATHQNFITFLEKKIKPEDKKHQQQKHAYYWNKNKEAVERLRQLHKGDEHEDYLNETLTFINNDLESVDKRAYKPKLLSDVADWQNKPDQYKNRTLLNFKTLDSIKHTECSNQDDKPRFKVTSLYEEKRQNLDDWQISTKKTKDKAQTIIVKTLIELANSHSVSLKHLSYIILESIDRDGYSSIKGDNDNNGKKLSADFQEKMKEVDEEKRLAAKLRKQKSRKAINNDPKKREEALKLGRKHSLKY